jgi:cold shock CspA family protein
MAKSKQSYNKREKEKSRAKKREDKLKRKEVKKQGGGSDSDNMIAWVDEFGNITDTPPDPNAKRTEIKAEDIVLGVPAREDEPETEQTGTVINFDQSRGFGFIRDHLSGESYFSHVNDHIDKIAEGDKVQFKIVRGLKGLNAVEVKKI